MRPAKDILKGISKPYHWKGLFRGFSVYTNPIIDMSAYIFGLKRTAVHVHLKCDDGFSLVLNDRDDLITVHEIFARNDYPVVGNEKIILDIGGNIGVSAKFFHLRCPLAKILSFEPDPRNFHCWQVNHSTSNGDLVILKKYAVVADDVESVWFTQLSSGRHGGVGVPGEKKIKVPAMPISKIIDDLLREHDEIDLIKIDIENMETEILASIEPRFLKKIKRIYAELPYGCEFNIDGFSKTVQGQVHQFERI